MGILLYIGIGTALSSLGIKNLRADVTEVINHARLNKRQVPQGH